MKDRVVILLDPKQTDWIATQAADRSCSKGQVVRDAVNGAMRTTGTETGSPTCTAPAQVPDQHTTNRG